MGSSEQGNKDYNHQRHDAVSSAILPDSNIHIHHCENLNLTFAPLEKVGNLFVTEHSMS
jgi:hypothetical protein